jgi:predicted permease
LAGYPKEKTGALYRRILQTVSAIPGVESASLSIVRPVDDQYYLIDVVDTVDGRRLPDRERIRVAWNSLSENYFATVGMPLLRGRDFDAHDGPASSRVMIVNESLARQALPGQDPIGHRLGGAEIVGVVKDALYGGAREQPRPVLYRSVFQGVGGTDPGSWVGVGGLSFELRYGGGSRLVDDVRRAVASVDRNLPVFRIKTLRAQTDDSLVRERLLAMLSTFFGGLGLGLACLGLYGLMAYGVARRTGEIGVRMALGARRGQIVWMVAREGLLLVAGGIAAGIPLAVWGSRYARALLFGVDAAGVLTIAVPALVLITVAALAGFLPALRASRVDPMTALRYE